MIGFSIWLTITLSGPPTLDIGGHVALSAPTRVVHGRLGGIALPHLVLVDPTSPNWVARHEAGHALHWDSLGPAFPIAYALTAGSAFEEYRGGSWIPPASMLRNCPLARVSSAGLSFAPCWEGVWH